MHFVNVYAKFYVIFRDQATNAAYGIVQWTILRMYWKRTAKL